MCGFRIRQFLTLLDKYGWGEEALREANTAAALWIRAAKAEGRRIPKPISEKEFKTRFPLRIPEDVRRRLELEARRKGISLNPLILRKIA